MSRPIVAIDIDDTLAVHASEFLVYSNQRWGTRLAPDEYDDHWSRMWGVDMAETESRAEQYVSDGIYRRYEVIDQAVPVLRRLSERCRLIVVTSRRHGMRDMTMQWVEEHFDGIFTGDEVYFAGIWDNLSPDRYRRTKAELVQSLGANYLIDDQLKHAFGAAERGVKSILFGEYSWNQANQPLPAGVVRRRNWIEVGEYFDELVV